MKQLKQKRGSQSRQFLLHQEGIEVEIQSQDSYSKFILKYESIEAGEYVYSQQGNFEKVALVVSIFFNILFIVLYLFGLPPIMAQGPYAFVAGGLSFVFLIGAVVFFKKLIDQNQTQYFKEINSHPKVDFLYHDSDKQVVDEFIAEIYSRRYNYLRSKYMKIERFRSPEEHKELFLWLFDQKIITESELEVLMDEINKRNIIDGY